MRRRRAAVALAALGFAFAAALCDAAEVKESHQILGSLVDVTVDGPDETFAQDRIRDAIAVARLLEADFAADRGNSDLARLNAASGLGPVKVSLDLYRILALSQVMTRSTGDAFDVTVGPLLQRRQAGTGQRRDVDEALDLVGADRILLQAPNRAELADSGMSIDLSAIEKGYLLERMAASLRAAGVTRALLGFGDSTVVAIGPPEPDSPFRIRVARGKSMAGSVALRDRALSTARARRRGEESAQPPIVDPRSGRFVENDRQATVVARDAAIADAWSTALVVDPDGTLGLLDEPRDVEALVFDEHGEHRSPRFVAFSGWKAARTAPGATPDAADRDRDGGAAGRRH